MNFGILNMDASTSSKSSSTATTVRDPKFKAHQGFGYPGGGAGGSDIVPLNLQNMAGGMGPTTIITLPLINLLMI